MQNVRLFSIALVIGFVFTTNSFAADSTATTNQQQYQFNGDGSVSPLSKDIKFKVPTTEKDTKDSTQANPVDNIPNDEPFKTYIGYPKHTIQVDLMPLSLSEKWSYNGYQFNFSSQTMGVDLLYRLVITPQMNLELNYNQFGVKVNAGNVGSTYSILDSSTTIQNYNATYNYYWIAQNNFFHRWGLGVDAGYNSYAVLGFAQSVVLDVRNAKDTTVGVHFNYQYPLIPNLLFVAKLGLAVGTGLGNSGYLTTKRDDIFYGNLGLDWTLSNHSSINTIFVYSTQNATISGPLNSSITDKWQTTSGLVGGKIGYAYTF